MKLIKNNMITKFSHFGFTIIIVHGRKPTNERETLQGPQSQERQGEQKI